MSLRTFALAATNAAGTTQASATVDVATPPPPIGSFALHKVPLDLTQLVVFDDHHYSSRYERYVHHKCLTTDAFKLGFHWTDLTLGGAEGPFHYPKYGVLFGDGTDPGVECATYTRIGTEKRGNFLGDLGALPDGPYMVQVVAYDAAGGRVANPTECFVPYWLWVDRTGQARNHPDVIFQMGSYDWTTHEVGANHFWMRGPKASLKNREVPLKWWNHPTKEIPVNAILPGVFPGGEPFDTALPHTQITRLNWVPAYYDNFFRPCITKRGITVTENIQGYAANAVTGFTPKQALLDGPRGTCTVFSPTAFWIGHSGVIYGCDSYAFWKINQQGEKHTFAGLRHPKPIYWEEQEGNDQTAIPGVVVEGDWDPSIPFAKRFPWECWGLVIDERSVHQDPNLPLVNLPPFGMLPQHLGEGPVFFLTCRGPGTTTIDPPHGRLLKSQFHKSRPTDPPTMTEWITGLGDPWGLAIDGNILYIAERSKHRISMWSADTPNTPLGVVLENPNGANYGAIEPGMRRWDGIKGANGLPDYALMRTQDILAPEGLAFEDGFIYWASMAQGEVRRINLATRVIEVCCRPLISMEQSRWVEIKLSDGTFGPRGTIFTTTFDNQSFGRPLAFLPMSGTFANTDGLPATHTKMVPHLGGGWDNLAAWHWTDHQYGAVRGPGYTMGQVYPGGIGVGNGLLCCGSTGPGLAVFTLNNIGDVPPSPKVLTGYTKYNAKGYRLRYGHFGFSHIDGPLPWGEDSDIDAFLEYHEHVKS